MSGPGQVSLLEMVDPPLESPGAGSPDPSSDHAAVIALLRYSPVADDLAERFAAAGHRLYLVGGSVRDALLGRLSSDLDFTTDARPEAVRRLVSGWAEAVWDTGIEFGTIGAARHGVTCEITTFRADRYDGVSRNPVVAFGDTVEDDLVRRDFTANAMAVSLPDRTFVDPCGGLAALARGVLDTPVEPERSFADDPLRLLRAARFVAQLGFGVTPRVVGAMTAMAPELGRITRERVQAELSKLLCGDHPRRGLELMVETGLADVVLPEVPAMRLEIDEHAQHKDVYEHSLTVLEQAVDREEDGPDLVLRLAALLHDVGKPATRRIEPGQRVSFHHHEVVGAKMVRRRLRELRYPKVVVDEVAQLVFLHLRFHGYGKGEWTDSAVRRYVTDAGPLLDRLHKLVRSDSTTRNKRRAAALQRSYDDLEDRIARISAEEDLARVRPDLDGNAIMELLGVPPGPLVGRAWRHLKDVRLEQGPLDRDAAEAELLAWARAGGVGTVGAGPDAEPRAPRAPRAPRVRLTGRNRREAGAVEPVCPPPCTTASAPGTDRCTGTSPRPTPTSTPTAPRMRSVWTSTATAASTTPCGTPTATARSTARCSTSTTTATASAPSPTRRAPGCGTRSPRPRRPPRHRPAHHPPPRRPRIRRPRGIPRRPGRVAR